MADFCSSKTHVANCSKWSSCWCRRKLSTTRLPSTTYLRSAWSNGAAVSLSCDVENPEERVLHRSLGRRHLLQGHDESSATRLPSEAVLLCINFSDASGFLEKLKMRTVEEKKDTELFLHVWFSKSNFTYKPTMLKECWMLLESQEQEGRSWQRRLVRKVLYCSSRCFRSQRRRRADERTFDASHDVFKTGCSKLWSCLHEIKFFSSTGWYRRHFSFSLFTVETEA